MIEPFVHCGHDLYFDVNFDRYYPEGIHTDSQNSSHLLGLTIELTSLEQSVAVLAKDIQLHFGCGTTVWGVKYKDKKFFVEFYFFRETAGIKSPRVVYPKHSFSEVRKFTSQTLSTDFRIDDVGIDYGCISFEYRANVFLGLNFYDGRMNGNHIQATSHFLHVNSVILESINTYHAFVGATAQEDTASMLVDCFKRKFPDENEYSREIDFGFPYLRCDNRAIYPMGIAEKSDSVGLYYSELTIEDFLRFLTYHEYPLDFIEGVKRKANNLSHMKFDVGVDVNIVEDALNVVKSSFFGTL
jgi:hypothetical protein